jgi:hypothetical protein
MRALRLVVACKSQIQSPSFFPDESFEFAKGPSLRKRDDLVSEFSV